ncbi:metal-dependent hydrolase [Halomonas sp. PAMB 3264]|uniref:metal-dependent hydrolase n=1 Tax=Halomonas sp. PAMB 3264 TaxID=3075222 RepID=UPI00289C55A7|nr:metal-dependent hydrolase [Halomonas sp. PAMB 3264]WNL42836.1 metal-dependent hydrolase [Halomonas sp. PAMB 3264]
MDSITQAALGAAVGGAVMGRRLGRKAVVVGALLGTLPDLDVALDYGDAIANVTEHRGFSHSLFVLTGLGTLLALLSRYALAGRASLARWWCFFTLILITHPLLDSLTTYGTQLLWPLDTPPVAWPVVFIIDPLYSLALLGGLVAACVSRRVVHYCALGLALSCAYLLMAAGMKWSVEIRLAPALEARGLDAAPLIVQPTPFNILLWRATAVEGERYFEGLVSVFDDDSAPRLEAFQRQREPLEPVALSGPLGQRLTWFSGAFLRYEIESVDGVETLVATDLRLGFPGFHPFTFTLATREDGEWQAVAESEQRPSQRGLNAQTLSHLVARIAGNQGALCASDFIEQSWRVPVERYACRPDGLTD